MSTQRRHLKRNHIQPEIQISAEQTLLDQCVEVLVGCRKNPDINRYGFLTADPAERAKRRFLELKEKGTVISLAKIRSDIEQRDKSDRDRKVGPLKPADDAITLDTTNMNIEQAVDAVYDIVKDKL